jgi:hypothetical protein
MVNSRDGLVLCGHTTSQDHLAFIYNWAVEGPPVVMPLGMLAKPKAFLASVQQVWAYPLGATLWVPRSVLVVSR